jgi:putative transposase
MPVEFIGLGFQSGYAIVGVVLLVLCVSITNNRSKDNLYYFQGMPSFITEYPQFFTATNLEWKPLLQPDKYKDIIISSIDFLVRDKRVILYGFVIMNNHIHIIWQMQPGIKRDAVQRDFLKFTAQKIKKDMLRYHRNELLQFKVNAEDRKFQFWERNPLSIDLWSREVLIQKLNYLHQNPVRAGLCTRAEEYKYSSALFYETGDDNWGFLTHYAG